MTDRTQDEIRFIILDDGTLRIETDDISPANHLSADEFLAAVKKEMGGEVARRRAKSSRTKVRDQVQQAQGR